ncbi:MAG TPA: hypothetical protein VJU86_07125 [Pyrinomonadaceae bacterium]|nr:hypothetical protein [Pyrinomonadaceae bacterium]
MWRCSNCEAQIDDKHAFCWQCGQRRVPHQEQATQQGKDLAVPGFASFEQLAPEPASHGWIFKRGLPVRLISYAFLLVIFVVFKILSSRFFGAYGLYIFVGAALAALIFILWRFFHRDTSEGVGIKLH